MNKFPVILTERHSHKATLQLVLIIAWVTLSGCSMLNTSNEPNGYQETLVNLQIQQTMVSQEQAGVLQQTLAAQNSTMQAQEAQQATQAAQLPPQSPTEDPSIAIQQTIQAQQPTTQAAASATPEMIEPSPTIDLISQMKSANILLYEDMVANTDTNRYVKDTLDRMGLTYKDDGNAQGWFKSDILSGAPNGKPWDLVIVAAEAKTGVQGEFFEYITDVLNTGSSVILEVWYLDQVAGGTASILLEKCGVEFEKDWSKVPPSRMVMFPLNAEHPIMREPNSALSFTKVTSYWWDETLVNVFDIGDWVRVVPGGDATLLVGTIAKEKMTHGTVAVCIDDRLILQTFSSHQLSYNAMTPVWENYIYHALKVRFENFIP